MAFNALVVQVMISAPGDLPDQHREDVHRAMRRWNVDHGRAHSIIFVPTNWTEGSTPGIAGEYAQELINEQLVGASDLGIVIYTDRLGTPTPTAESGTVEETDRFIQADKEVLTYRNNVPRPPLRGTQATAEKARLEAYLEKAQTRALVGQYNSSEDLALKLQTDLTRIAVKVRSGLPETTPIASTREPEDLLERGIWPTIETERVAVVGNVRGKLSGGGFTYRIVFRSTLPYSVTNVRYWFEDTDGNEVRSFDEGNRDTPRSSLPPHGEFSKKLERSLTAPASAECVVEWTDRDGTERRSRTTVSIG